MRSTPSSRSTCGSRALDGTLRSEMRNADAAAAIFAALRRCDTLVHLAAVSRPPLADRTVTSSRTTCTPPSKVQTFHLETELREEESSSEAFWTSVKTERVKGRTHREKE